MNDTEGQKTFACLLLHSDICVAVCWQEGWAAKLPTHTQLTAMLLQRKAHRGGKKYFSGVKNTNALSEGTKRRQLNQFIKHLLSR